MIGFPSPAVAVPASPGAATACSVSWTGGGTKSDWNIAANWSTGTVPGPASDVCISTTLYTYVFATGNITVHSLRLSGGGGLEVGETASTPVHSTVDATAFVDNTSSIGLYQSSLKSPKITSYNLAGNGIPGSGAHSTVTSPDFASTGVVDSLAGTLTLTDPLPQLAGGTLSGGQWDAFGNGTVLRLPEGVTSLAGSSVGMVNGGQIIAGGTNAVAGLTSIGSGAALDVAGNSTPVALSGDLASAGALNLGDYDSGGSLVIGGTYTAQPGSVTALAAASNLTATQITVQEGSDFSAGGGSVIRANVNNAGAFGVAGAALTLTGDYTQTASGSLGAGGGSELAVSGHATLAGSLSTYVGIVPRPGIRTTALTFASRTGDFSNVTLGFHLEPGTTQIDVVTRTQVAASPLNPAPGSDTTVSGAIFPYGTTVKIYLDHAWATPLATAAVGIHGSFQTSVLVPATTSPGAHQVVAVDGSSTASVPIDVT
jgi:hypothetical protein